MAEKIPAALTQLKTEPDSLVDYILMKNVPRELSGLDRGCIAVLAYEEVGKKTARARMSVGGKSKGQVGHKVNDLWQGKRWFDHAAHLVGTRAGCVKNLYLIRNQDANGFEAVRSRKIKTLTDARSLVQELKRDHGQNIGEPVLNRKANDDRKEVLRRYEDSGRKTKIVNLIHDVRRENRIARLPPPVPKGKHWEIYSGRMETEAGKVADASVDLVFADVLYGLEDAPVMAREVAKLSKRVMADDGVLAIMAGQVAIPVVIQTCIAEGLYWQAVGFVDYDGGSRGGGAVVTNNNADPVLFFSRVERPKRKLVQQLKFSSGAVDKRFFTWQKSTDAMMAVIKATVGDKAVILDPCCGSGSTLEAAVRLGHTAIGIEVDPTTAHIAQRRLREVEEMLANPKEGTEMADDSEPAEETCNEPEQVPAATAQDSPAAVGAHVRQAEGLRERAKRDREFAAILAAVRDPKQPIGAIAAGSPNRPLPKDLTAKYAETGLTFGDLLAAAAKPVKPKTCGTAESSGKTKGTKPTKNSLAFDLRVGEERCARAGWMMELAADRVMAIVPA